MVQSRPESGRVQFTYLHGRPDLRINGIDPEAEATSIVNLAVAIEGIQDAVFSGGFLFAETELYEEQDD